MKSIECLKNEQLKLAKKVITKDKFKRIRLIGGCDCAFVKDKVISAIIICDKDMDIIEKKYSISKIKFPYIPGFLSYREVPSLIMTYKKIKNKPDILICDCNGILHPRRLGAASHLGVLLNKTTIGVAKSLLLGKIKNNYIYVNNEKRGFRLKNKNFKAVYISPGHKILLRTSIKIIKKLFKEHRLPEPLYLAHKYANEVKCKI